MKRLIVLLLAICLAIPMVSCGNKEENGGGATDTTGGNNVSGTGDDDRSNAVSSLPEGLDFDNSIINIVIRDRDDIAFEIDPDANTVDVLATEIARCNTSVEDTLNVAFQFQRLPGTFAQKDSFISTIRNNRQLSGNDLYDLVMGPNYSLTPLMVEGYFANLYNVPYLDLGADWWNGNFNDECSYAGKLYMTEGELMLSMIDSAFVMFFDTANFRDLVPDQDIYDIVRSGDWTLDLLSSFVKDVYVDNNGDSAKDSGDLFGMVSPAFASGRDGFQTAFGVSVTTKEDDGRITLNFNSERNVNIYDDFYTFLHDNEGVYVNGNNDAAREDCRSMFQNGRVIFITELLNYAGILRGLEREYGVIPLPKYDSSQNSYSVASEAVHSQLSVFAYSPRQEAAGAVAEMLCFLTYRDVTLDYYDTVKYRNQKTPEAVEMLDLIVSSITSNFGAQFSSEMATPFPTPIGEKNNISDQLSSQQDRMQTLMDNFKRKIQALP